MREADIWRHSFWKSSHKTLFCLNVVSLLVLRDRPASAHGIGRVVKFCPELLFVFQVLLSVCPWLAKQHLLFLWNTTLSSSWMVLMVTLVYPAGEEWEYSWSLMSLKLDAICSRNSKKPSECPHWSSHRCSWERWGRQWVWNSGDTVWCRPQTRGVEALCALCMETAAAVTAGALTWLPGFWTIFNKWPRPFFSGMERGPWGKQVFQVPWLEHIYSTVC